MLQTLREIEEQMSNFLKIESWRSLYIDYDYPYVERVYLDWEKFRINLHIIHPIQFHDYRILSFKSNQMNISIIIIKYH